MKRLALFMLLISMVVLSGCGSMSYLKYDKSAMAETTKVAVLVFSVPPTIKYRNDPKASDKQGILNAVVAMATAKNGARAATLAQDSFIEYINASGLRLTALTRDQMMSNEDYRSIGEQYAEMTEISDEEETTNQALNVAGKVLGLFFDGIDLQQPDLSIGAKGQPSFGLATNWVESKTALIGDSNEAAYIKESIEALGVDAAIVINDPGISFSCDACLAGTGVGSTGSAFLVTLVDREGNAILDMREWFNISDGTAAMATYVVNPLQHDSLFKGHGSKMARVFVDFYKEKGGI